MKIIRMTLLAALCAGCAANRVDHDNAQRMAQRVKAEAGDPHAQYLLGEAYCCGSGFYSTDEAIAWWCKAAASGHLQAQRRLREIAGSSHSARCAATAD